MPKKAMNSLQNTKTPFTNSTIRLRATWLQNYLPRRYLTMTAAVERWKAMSTE